MEGYIAGQFGSTLKTVNGGNTWTSAGQVPTYSEGLWFTSSNVGYMVGSYNAIAKTTNGGASWVNQLYTSGSSGYYSDICFPSTNTGYAVGNMGKIQKTQNGGANWTALTSGTNQTLYSVYFNNNQEGYVSGGFGLIMKTIDGGINWTIQTTGITQSIYQVFFQNLSTGYAVGGSGIMLKTTNGGTNWTIQTSVTNQSLYDVMFVDADTGYAVGTGGTILKTTNAGAYWGVQPSPVLTDLFSISFPDSHTGYISGSKRLTGAVYTGIILKTTNGGGPIYNCAPVLISAQPQDLSICAGYNASFSVSAYGASPFSYRWYKNGILVDSTISTSSQVDSLPASSFTTADSGSTIYCVITNQCWDSTTTQAISDTVSLAVNPACTFVSLVTPLASPQMYTIDVNNGPAIFTITVAGTPPFIYKWYVDNVLMRIDTLLTTSSTYGYSTSFPLLTHTYEVTCTVSNCLDCGTGNGGGSTSVTSIAQLYYLCAWGSMSSSPMSQTKTVCQTATFSVFISVPGLMGYEWYKNGSVIPGAFSSSYTTPALTLADNGNTYYCKAYWCNGNESDQSNTATLTIIQPASITQQPTNQTFIPGAMTTMNVSVNGPPPFSYYWYTNGVLSSNTLNTSSTNSSFVTPPLTLADTGNSYYCIITNGAGCYSVTSDTAHFNSCNTFNSISQTACDSFSINGQTYTNTGLYTQTLVNHTGCDSILIIDLTLASFNNSIVQQPLNNQFNAGTTATFTTSINGNSPFSYFWFNNGVLIDSVINTTSTISSYTTPSLSLLDIGNYYYCVITFGAGCDTITSDTARFICTSSNSISPVACDSISINGQNYASSGVYTQTLSNQYGCDSTLTINLTITNLVDSILQNGSTLSSSIAGANYQWVDCENGLAPIAGATNQTFNPTVNGFYALIINKGLCVDTSACYNVNSVGINKLDFEDGISIFPSPVKNDLQITSTSKLINEIKLYNSIGALLMQQKQNKKQVSIDLSSYANGIYFVEVKTATKIFRRKVLKE